MTNNSAKHIYTLMIEKLNSRLVQDDIVILFADI